MKLLLSLALTISIPVCAQGLLDHFVENRIVWEKGLENGSGASVRKSVEEFIKRETIVTNPYDYNSMHAIISALDIAAKACAMDGSWEDAVAFLKRAHQTAADNASKADHTFSKLLAQHNKKLKEWQEDINQQEKRIQSPEGEKVLTDEQQKLNEQIQISLDEHRRAITHSERSIKEIGSLLTTLKREKEVHANSLSNWQTFLDKERADITKIGTVTSYVTEKLKQIKVDTKMINSDRLSYSQRLLHLDPSNLECRRFVGSLTGKKNILHVPVVSSKTKNDNIHSRILHQRSQKTHISKSGKLCKVNDYLK